MTTKEFLKKGRRLNFELAELEEAKKKAFEQACRAVCDTGGERVQASGGNTSEKRNIEYADYTGEIKHRIVELSKHRHEMLKIIYSVDNSLYRAILVARYINCEKWEDIAENMNFSVRRVFQLHNAALKKL